MRRERSGKRSGVVARNPERRGPDVPGAAGVAPAAPRACCPAWAPGSERGQLPHCPLEIRNLRQDDVLQFGGIRHERVL